MISLSITRPLSLVAERVIAEVTVGCILTRGTSGTQDI